MSVYLLASNNAGKLREFREIFKEDTILSLKDIEMTLEVEEDGETFEENAVKKASEAARCAGMTAIADDSGLCVDSLHGAPGIYSARYAGEAADDQARIEKLLKEMEHQENRSARFVSVVALADPEGRIVTACGECEGKILMKPEGIGGFGYDPVFYVEEFGKTFAQLSGDEKNSISHRGKAIRSLKETISKL